MDVHAGTGTVTPLTGDEFLESIKDGREIWAYGERVADVTTHPAFRNAAQSIASIYDMKRGDAALAFEECGSWQEAARRTGYRDGSAARQAVELRTDYRDVDGQFDRVASIEMFEAVGERYWPTYFDKIRESLPYGGIAGLQIITIRDEYFEHYKRTPDFIQKYIFPGGMLPSEERLKVATDRAGLSWGPISRFGVCYADTLAEWARRFEAAWDEITHLGFDERFRKLWRFYLSYCEAGFRTQRTDVVQLSLIKA